MPIIYDSAFSAFMFSPWFWVALTVLFSLIELATAFSLTTIWFAISSFLMVFISFTPLPFKWQCALSLVIAAVLLIYTRPIAVKKLKVGEAKTNIDELCGKTVIVTKRITEFEKGEVKINGLFWSAKLSDSDVPSAPLTPLEKGAKCIIQKIEGNTVAVISSAE
ncbi:MAG: hypothetical protein Ta2A_14100 [Treponemataceae bacterium]|nr:MAG: hypothetical protein Ta2A_14100 [Treponemataceae bacterium]